MVCETYEGKETPSKLKISAYLSEDAQVLEFEENIYTLTEESNSNSGGKFISKLEFTLAVGTLKK